VIDDASTFRTKDQVLFDLSKALGFSPASLEANRRGRLSPDQFKQFIGRCVSPAVIALFSAVLPIVFWTGSVGMREHAPFITALSVFIGQLMHLNDMLDSQGKISTLFTVGSILAGLVFAAYMGMRFSPAMYFDLLAREVATREGRVIAREEQTLRPNGRDPIEKYYFNLKNDRFDVNFAAYRALENGSTYLIYVLPRSGVLVSMEPKVVRSGLPKAKPAPPTAPVTPPAPVSI